MSMTVKQCRDYVKDVVLRMPKLELMAIDFALFGALNEFYNRVHPVREMVKGLNLLAGTKTIDVGVNPEEVIWVKAYSAATESQYDVFLEDYTALLNSRKGLDVYGNRLPPEYSSEASGLGASMRVDRLTGTLAPNAATSFLDISAAFDPTTRGTPQETFLEFFRQHSTDLDLTVYRWKQFEEWTPQAVDQPTLDTVIPVSKRMMYGILSFGVPCYYNDRVATPTGYDPTRKHFEMHIEKMMRIADAYDTAELP